MQSTPGSTTLPDSDGTYQCSNDAKSDGDGGLSGGRVDWRTHLCQQPWRFTLQGGAKFQKVGIKSCSNEENMSLYQNIWNGKLKLLM